jgi:ribosomal protein L32E
MTSGNDDKYDSGFEREEPAPEDTKPSGSDGGAKGPTNATRMRRRRPNAPTAPATQASNTFGDTFGVDVAEQAKGNFLITVGFPGSGKSTFHSHIYRMCEELHHVDPLHASGQPPGTVDPIMESRLNAWRRRYHAREQVESTISGEANIYEIAFRVVPKTRPSKPLDLRIIEVSGEDLRQLDNSATGGNVAEIPQAIGALLHDEKLNERKTTIAIMVDPTPDASPVEYLVDGLLSYMNVHGPKRLKQTRFCIIVPKPLQMLEALQEYKNQYPDIWSTLPKKPTLEAYRSAKDVDGNLTSFYLAVFKKNLVQRLKTVAVDGGIMRSQFYLGEIEEQFFEDEGEEKPIEVLTSINYRDASTVFSFIYEGFTGFKLKPGVWDRFRGR